VKQYIHAVVSFDPSILIEQLGFHWTNFRELLCWEFLLKPVNQIKIWLKLNKNWHFTRRLTCVYNTGPYNVDRLFCMCYRGGRNIWQSQISNRRRVVCEVRAEETVYGVNVTCKLHWLEICRTEQTVV